MAIKRETEFLHKVLGPICFDDGSPLPNYDQQPCEPKWVARPKGWDTDFEYYMAGEPDGPDARSMETAIRVNLVIERVQREARLLAGMDLDLAWVDCTTMPPKVALTYGPEVYSLWQGPLDGELHLASLTKGQW